MIVQEGEPTMLPRKHAWLTDALLKKSALEKAQSPSFTQRRKNKTFGSVMDGRPEQRCEGLDETFRPENLVTVQEKRG